LVVIPDQTKLTPEQQKYADVYGITPLFVYDRKDLKWQEGSLKNVADIFGIKIGIAGQYKDKALIEEYFNKYVSAWAFSWDITDPPLRSNIDSFYFNHTDYAVNFANDINSPIAIYHLVWGLYSEIPEWLKNSNLSTEEYQKIMQDHISKIVTRYKGKVAEWVVVNEPYGESGNPSFWKDKLGWGPEWIDKAFYAANIADPNATLLLNDFGIEFMESSKSQQIYDLVKGMKERGVPIDTIGFQMHLSAFDLGTGDKLNQKMNSLRENIRRYKAMGVNVSFTELDISLHGFSGNEFERILAQAEIYRKIMVVAKEEGVTDVTIFGAMDKDSWLVSYYGFKDSDALLFDDDGIKKPSYFTVISSLAK